MIEEVLIILWRNYRMQLAEVLKLKLNIPSDEVETAQAFEDTCYQYMLACNAVSKYVFEHDFYLNTIGLSKQLYSELRKDFQLKSQMAQSAIRTVVARYKSVDTQLKKKPAKFRCDGLWYKQYRDIRHLKKQISFHRPQADFVRNKDYSFVCGMEKLSINTLSGRKTCTFSIPSYMQKFLDGTWKFGTAKLVCLKRNWYLHISVTKEVSDFQKENVAHVVGIDRGLRFIATVYDDEKKTSFASGKDIMHKRKVFDTVRARLQSKGTKSAKRVLKRISGRENRWMSDVNHCLSKTLVEKYGPNTLFVLEDLEDVSTDEQNFHSPDQTHDLRNWAFYDLETKLTYKAHAAHSEILKVAADYTSQRCPRCGRIRKENRDHKIHMYHCDQCGFQTNDDRIGAMNIWQLGMMWLSGDKNPTFATDATVKAQT